MSGKPRLILAFSVATTGPRLPLGPGGGDALIAVGWTGGRLDGSGPAEVAVAPAGISVDLGKPRAKAWSAHWEARGWDRPTFKGRWEGKQRTLDALQAKTSSLATASHLLNRELAELEERYEITPVVDDAGVTAAWIDVLLAQQGYFGLGCTRTGTPRRILDSYSYRLGQAWLAPEHARAGHENGSADAQAAFGATRTPLGDVYDYSSEPAADSKVLLLLFLESRKLNTRLHELYSAPNAVPLQKLLSATGGPVRDY